MATALRDGKTKQEIRKWLKGGAQRDMLESVAGEDAVGREHAKSECSYDS